MRNGCEFLVGESNENHEQYLFQEAYNLVVNQIYLNIQDIDEMRIDHAHGVDISQQMKTLKWEFNFELADNRHPKLVIPLKGEIWEAWGLGSVWKTFCGTIYGMYHDEESNKYIAMYLGRDEEVALGRMNFVKNFIM